MHFLNPVTCSESVQPGHLRARRSQMTSPKNTVTPAYNQRKPVKVFSQRLAILRSVGLAVDDESSQGI